MSKNLTSQELAAQTMQAILTLPVGALFQALPEIIAGKFEEIRAENIKPGLLVNGKERLLNGTYRLHCMDGVYVVPYFQETGRAAVDELLQLNDFSQMRLQYAVKLINEKVQQMEAAKKKHCNKWQNLFLKTLRLRHKG